MNWKLKALIQNTVSRLPYPLNDNIYYRIQKYFGGLGRITPLQELSAGVRMCENIIKFNRIIDGKLFFEVGTGRRLSVPLVFWLLGSERIITVDLNQYLIKELIKQDLNYINENQKEIRDLFKGLKLYNDRFQKLIELNQTSWNIEDLLQLCNIEYISLGDAANVDIENNCVDFHISNTVFEHIHTNKIRSILQEGNRIINKDGLFIHTIDFGDHYCHADQSISSINMLQYSDKEWNRYVNNKYMYMNRLRIDDFINLYQSLKHNILSIESVKEKNILDLLEKNSLVINKKFKNKSKDVLSTTSSWIVTEKI